MIYSHLWYVTVAHHTNSPNKQSQLDPLPTWLLKKCVSVLAPFITALLNTSISSGVVPLSMKTAIVTPILKKPTLDSLDLKNFRPVSNLSLISKLLEKIISQQITFYLDRNSLLSKCQSAYRVHHSTETALLKVYFDLVEASDAGKVSLLTLLDQSYYRG